MVKNKWYECPHWTYKANRGWLIERGIVAFHWSNSQGFHWSIFPREKWNVLWETPKSFRVDPEVFPKKKRVKIPMRKNSRKIIPLTLPVMQLPVTSPSPTNVRPIQHDILLSVYGFWFPLWYLQTLLTPGLKEVPLVREFVFFLCSGVGFFVCIQMIPLPANIWRNYKTYWYIIKWSIDYYYVLQLRGQWKKPDK